MKFLPLSANAVELVDKDLKELTDEEINELIRMYFDHLVVIARNQSFTPQQLVEFADRIGVYERLPADVVEQRSPDGVDGVQRVCAGYNPDGTARGLFGHDGDLDWHANRPSAEAERKPIIMLYAAHDSAGSRISWANMAMAYADLPGNVQDWLEDKMGIYGFEPNTYTQSFNIWKPHRNLMGQKFIRTGPTGVRGMFFPRYQFFGFKDVEPLVNDEMVALLTEHAYQEKYFYHHDYQDGDIILGDQWLTVHKRWACELGNRMLYRVSMDWSKTTLE